MTGYRLIIGSLGTSRGQAIQNSRLRLLEANSVIHGTMNPLLAPDEVGSIVKCAKRHHANLLVLRMRNHSWLMTGHTAQDIAERAPCTVLGIK